MSVTEHFTIPNMRNNFWQRQRSPPVNDGLARNQDTLNNLTNSYKRSTKFIYFTPTSNNIGETNINTCYVSDEYNKKPTLNMVPINKLLNPRNTGSQWNKSQKNKRNYTPPPPVLHTKETCKLNAGLLHDKHKMNGAPIYYSLVEANNVASAAGLYNCYVTDPANRGQTANQIARNKDKQYSYKVIWTAISEQNEKQLLNKNNYLALDDKNNLSIYNGNSNIPIKQLSNIANGQIELAVRNGDLLIETTTVKDKSKNKYVWSNLTLNVLPNNLSGVANKEWSKLKFPNNISNRTTLMPNMTKFNNASGPILISHDSKFKLEFNNQGNLVIKMSIKGCMDSFGKGSSNYTINNKSSGQSFYPYRVDSTKFLNKIYLESEMNPARPTIKFIPDNSDIVKPANTFVKIDGYYSNHFNNAVDITNKRNVSCATLCNNDRKCNHYFDYRQGGHHMCSLGNSKLPAQFVPKQLQTPIQSSSLYIRDTKMEFNKDDIRQTLPQIPVDGYMPYSKMSDFGGVAVTKGDIYSGLTPELIASMKLQKSYKEGFSEEYRNNYEPNPEFINKYHSRPGIPDNVTRHKIKPLSRISKQYSNTLTKIRSKDKELTRDISKIKEIVPIMNNNDFYDFRGDLLNYNNKKPDLMDAMQEDVTQMNLVQTEMITLGAITIATLLIATIYIARG